MAISIRPADANDKARCLELLSHLSAATGSTMSPNAGDTFDSLVDKTRGEVLVATENDHILGQAAVSYNLAMRYGGEYCQLEELIVDPAARGKNIGGLLMEALLNRARSRGCAACGLYLLESTMHNQPFYEKYGFVALGPEMRQTLG